MKNATEKETIPILIPENASAVCRVLLIEDNETDAILVRRALRKGDNFQAFSLEHVDTLQKSLTYLVNTKPDIILLDLNLPDATGLETVHKVHEGAGPIPIVVLSGGQSDEVSIGALAVGVQDFLAKDELTAASLTKSIRYALARSQVAALEMQAAKQKQDEFNRLYELKSQFLANMSHEIRTPMNAIIAMTSLLLQTKLTAEQSEYTNTVRASGDALLVIINEILDFSKIQSGKSQLEKTDFEIRPLVESVVDLLSGQVSEKKIALFSHVDADVPIRIHNDPTRLQQVLINLTGNAIKFTDTGSVTIHVRLWKDNQLQFQITDTGIGVKDEDKDSLFQMFSQGNISFKKKFAGTGLGLAISKGIVEMMGGRIYFKSQYLKGTRFFVEIPMDACPAIPFVPRPCLKGKKVLLVSLANGRILATLENDLRKRDVIVASRPLDRLTKIFLGEEPNAEEVADLVIVYCADAESIPKIEQLLKNTPSISNVPRLWLLPKGAHVQLPFSETIMRFPYRQSKLYELAAGLITGQIHGQENDAPSAQQTKSTIRPFSQCHHLLVAEDNPINQCVVRRLLSKLGLSCEVVANGKEAVAAVQVLKYGAILMDCSMPEMDGWEATKTIRNMGIQTPIIAMTANAFKEDRDYCLNCGMDDYIAKPVTLESVAEMLHKVFGTTDTVSLPANQETPNVDTPLLNITKLRKTICQGSPDDDDFLNEIFNIFLDSAPETFAKVMEHLQSGSPQQLKSSAHRLKGMAANIGADRLQAMCETIENLARAGNADQARDLSQPLQQVWSDTFSLGKQRQAA